MLQSGKRSLPKVKGIRISLEGSGLPRSEGELGMFQLPLEAIGACLCAFHPAGQTVLRRDAGLLEGRSQFIIGMVSLSSRGWVAEGSSWSVVDSFLLTQKIVQQSTAPLSRGLVASRTS